MGQMPPYSFLEGRKNKYWLRNNAEDLIIKERRTICLVVEKICLVPMENGDPQDPTRDADLCAWRLLAFVPSALGQKLCPTTLATQHSQWPKVFLGASTTTDKWSI